MIATRELWELALEDCRPGCRWPQHPFCVAHHAAGVLRAIAASQVDLRLLASSMRYDDELVDDERALADELASDDDELDR